MPSSLTAGWDIGGAHLKAALADDGRIVAMKQIACPLWLGEDRLHAAFAEAGRMFTGAPFHAITMTGELAEIFPSRDVGVQRIVEIAEDVMRGAGRAYYAGERGFLDAEAAVVFWERVASANWRASAELVAANHASGLFIDIGSTTTDIVPFHGGRVSARATTDAERLVAGELVYTGVLRTSLMAVARRVAFGGEWHPLMAENFSTMADVYRLTGEVDPADDLYPASDARGKGAGDCMARLARMIGRDATDASADAWLALAQQFREAQLRTIHDAAAQVLSGGGLARGAPVIGAGAGHFLVRALSERMGRPYMDFTDLIPVSDEARRLARVCAPAAAVALLAASRVHP
jgi:probable H4MPT-linked C1 transfer pathway protein